MKRWVAAAVSAFVIVAVMTTAVATCMAGSLTSEQAQMACCKAGHHKCGPKGSAADCCKTTETQHHDWTTAKIELVKRIDRPAAMVVASTEPATPSAFLQPRKFERVSSPPGPSRSPGPTVYLLNAAFLI